MPENLRIAVCLFPELTVLDYQGPVEIFGFLSPENLPKRNWKIALAHTVTITYLSHTLDAVRPASGPLVLPQATYKEHMIKEKQYDIVLVPGGAGARPGNVPDDVLDFVKFQAPGCKYVLSVCTGSWILAGAGVLDGKRATTNKSVFAECKAATSDKIEWIAKARWVVDGNVWTSSGVTAGMDMAHAFVTHLVGGDVAKIIKNIIELNNHERDEDPFAEVYDLM